MAKQRAQPGYRRIVAKFGTNLLTAGTDRLDAATMSSLVAQVAALHGRGPRGADRHVRRDRRRARSGSTARRRPAATSPSGRCWRRSARRTSCSTYDRLFAAHDRVVAQTLLSKRDLADRIGYLNARNTLLGLLEMGVVPIVNENDAVAIDEIAGAKIGDNDNLSALVANLIDADLLALLTDTGGLYTADPRTHKTRDADRARRPRSRRRSRQIAGGSDSGRGTGGMVTKLQAAKLGDRRRLRRLHRRRPRARRAVPPRRRRARRHAASRAQRAASRAASAGCSPASRRGRDHRRCGRGEGADRAQQEPAAGGRARRAGTVQARRHRQHRAARRPGDRLRHHQLRRPRPRRDPRPALRPHREPCWATSTAAKSCTATTSSSSSAST